LRPEGIAMQSLSPEKTRTFNGHAPGREVSPGEAGEAAVELARRLRRLQAESAPSLEAARGRVLAEDVRSDRDAPPFRRSMRDGYAVRAAEGAAPRRLAGEVAAGGEFAGELPPAACVAIMTGAPVPAGADAVVMVEHTRAGNGAIEFQAAPAPGDNIAAVGSDLAAGAVIARAGRRVEAGVAAALASAGCVRPRVYRRPRLALLVTGDELVAPEAAPAGARIRDSNGPMLAAQAAAAGAEVVLQRRLPDDAAATEAAVREALDAAEVVVASGGASVGAHDALGGVLARLGAETVFDAVRQRPGRPVRCAAPAGRLLLALPGNPLGAMLGFALYVRPALDIFAGQEEPSPRILEAALAAPWQRPQPLPLTLLLPVRLADGAAAVMPYHGSADLAAAAAADAFVMIPENATALAAGARVRVLLP
jgi:molybdopterin molybdotransferase